jgi:hypothetical protein
MGECHYRLAFAVGGTAYALAASFRATARSTWASMKSLRAKDGSDEPPSGSRNSERDFHGEKRSNDRIDLRAEQHMRVTSLQQW